MSDTYLSRWLFLIWAVFPCSPSGWHWRWPQSVKMFNDQTLKFPFKKKRIYFIGLNEIMTEIPCESSSPNDSPLGWGTTIIHNASPSKWGEKKEFKSYRLRVQTLFNLANY